MHGAKVKILDKKFKHCLIICSPGVKDVRELKESISNTYPNMRAVIIHTSCEEM